ncbi:helix-turn-helix transcriptional regulator [Mucilaginibacter corticis]|uniref:Helix-turn-helix transcriptional regulator n=1 Tax=Mucilaginibacter corticis TaxID=2597670 RepID=A0A556M4R1_9SPHI|nr:AraC family transcriptional regulator [Mucilaginibacter corticis]TSJ34886.1 helix-turn-helix transcriptional regulator [Mucilaginibacter corticis]
MEGSAHLQPWAGFFPNDAFSDPGFLHLTATVSETFIANSDNFQEAFGHNELIHFYVHADYLHYCIFPVLPVNADDSVEDMELIVLKNSDQAKRDFKALQLCLDSDNPHKTIVCKALAHRFLTDMLGMLSAAQLACLLPADWLPGKASISYYLEANYTRKMTVEQLGAAMGQSLSTFKRNFAGLYETTPMEWLIRRRLEYAYFLVRYSDYSIAAFTVLCGFGGMSHFAKSYKAEFGYPPLKSKVQLESQAATIKSKRA